ncbi:hypothetical protein HanIR_Chr13g0654821 [Helianthus annuus]|nr:hypothetical protein HanIR_Chr13g0654821 [Helianthus annuus]
MFRTFTNFESRIFELFEFFSWLFLFINTFLFQFRVRSNSLFCVVGLWEIPSNVSNFLTFETGSSFNSPFRFFKHILFPFSKKLLV